MPRRPLRLTRLLQQVRADGVEAMVPDELRRDLVEPRETGARARPKPVSSGPSPTMDARMRSTSSQGATGSHTAGTSRSTTPEPSGAVLWATVTPMAASSASR